MNAKEKLQSFLKEPLFFGEYGKDKVREGETWLISPALAVKAMEEYASHQHDQLAEKLSKAVDEIVEECYQSQIWPSSDDIKLTIIKTLKG